MRTKFSPPYRVWTSITKEHFVINAKGGLEHGPFESLEDAQAWCDGVNAPASRCADRDRKPLPTASEQGLTKLRRHLRSAPSDRSILITSIATLLMTFFSSAAITYAILAWIGD